MKKKIEDIAKKTIADLDEKKITRKEAIKKAGLVAVSAATMMMLLSSPNNAQAASPPPALPPGWGGGI
jgi:hypothetical protein